MSVKVCGDVSTGQQRTPSHADGQWMGAEAKIVQAVANAAAPRLMQGLNDPLSPLITGLIRASDPVVDIRYQLTWTFGTFIIHLPCRLGSNRALDSAAKALVQAHNSYCSDRKNPTRQAVVEYSAALRALRLTLNDPIAAPSAETLSAIYVIMIVQSLIGSGDQSYFGHSRGVTRILKARGQAVYGSTFEKTLLLVLRGPVVIEALFDDDVSLSPQEWEALIMDEAHGNQPRSTHSWFGTMARIALCVQRRRSIYSKEPLDALALIHTAWELKQLQQEFQPVLESVCKQYNQARLNLSSDRPVTSQQKHMTHAFWTRIYSLFLVAAVLISSLLQASNVPGTTSDIPSSFYSLEILRISGEMEQYKPMGAMTLVLSLPAAWFGATDQQLQDSILEASTRYQKDIYPLMKVMGVGNLLYLKKRLTISS